MFWLVLSTQLWFMVSLWNTCKLTLPTVLPTVLWSLSCPVCTPSPEMLGILFRLQIEIFTSCIMLILFYFSWFDYLNETCVLNLESAVVEAWKRSVTTWSFLSRYSTRFHTALTYSDFFSTFFFLTQMCQKIYSCWYVHRLGQAMEIAFKQELWNTYTRVSLPCCF